MCLYLYLAVDSEKQGKQLLSGPSQFGFAQEIEPGSFNKNRLPIKSSYYTGKVIFQLNPEERGRRQARE